MKILVTGATGFVGKRLTCVLAEKEHDVIAAVRSVPEQKVAGAAYEQIIDFNSVDEWTRQLQGVDCVVHAAARVHVMNEVESDPLQAFRAVNVAGTMALAEGAVRAGVKRLVFISSIKVNGEGTQPPRAYTADDAPAPADPYGISKMEAEQALIALGSERGLEVVIVRPVLVYGPGVKANFRSMMSWLYKRIPLPLGAIDNRRSLVFIDNLVDLIRVCCGHPGAVGQTFLVSDGTDVSTTQLLRKIGRALGVRPVLIGVPVWALSLAAAALGKKAVSHRLCGSLQVDITKNDRLLNWKPPIAMDTALETTARDFKESLKK